MYGSLAKRPLLLALVLAWGCASRSAALDPEAYTAALEDRIAFRSQVERSCPDLLRIEEVLAQAIAVGAPIYNAGSPLGCFRIYEGAAYKLLWELEARCPAASGMLQAGLRRAEIEAHASDKAWTMRRTFDAILGEPTSYGPPAETFP